MSSSGLVDLGRQKVMKRLISGTHRDDILGKLIDVHIQDRVQMTSEQIDDLTAEAVTLL